MIRQRRAELEAMIDDVAPPGWRDDRRWRALVTAAAICEPWGRRARGYLASNGEPHADTFMASPQPGPTELAGWIGWAIAAAHALCAALAARDGEFPRQPLQVRIDRRFGNCALAPMTGAAARTVGFAIGGDVVIAELDPRGPASEGALARRLATPGARGDSGAPGGARPIAIVSLGDDELAVAQHGHRRGWDAGGGPWVGVARAEGLTVVSTCHLAIDGFAHAHLAHDVAAAIDRAAARALAAQAAALVGDAAPPALRAVADALPLGLAWRRVPGPMPKVARQAWTLGRVLAAANAGVRARGASLQIPVAAGGRDDPDRFARRVRTALATVRFPDGRPEPEPYETFAARAREAIADAALGRGLLDRLLAALAGAPVPLGLKRRWLARRGGGGERGGPGDVLAGDGCVSLLRGLPPLVAASVPGRVLAIDDEEASAVLTVIDDGASAIATIAGRGRAGTAAGAAALLDAWAEGQADDRAATIPA